MPKFGVAGYPPAFSRSKHGKDRMKICAWVRELGLDALELQMTYGPRTSPENCAQYRDCARDNGITLTVHGSYFIVFTSDEKDKIQRSADTLKRTFELCSILDARVIVLHPGPLYGTEDARTTLDRFIENLSKAMTEIGKTDIGLFVETAGKVGQLGSVDEILTISEMVPGVFPCIDFGHVHARTLGTLKTRESVFRVFEHLAARGWLSPERKVHFHYTPIHYGNRGEIVHRAINDRYPIPSQTELFADESAADPGTYYSPRFEHVAEGLAKWKPDCIVISETHDSQEEGAQALRDAYSRFSK